MASRADEQNLNLPVSAEETDYEQLIDDYSHFAPPHDGELLQGRVVKLHEKDVIVDFGYKSEGLVPIEQFLQPDGSVQVGVGDFIDVMVDRQGLQPEGYILLSHEKASRLRSWDNIEKAQRDGLVVSGRVTGRIKGGLSVDVGVPAFMPGSQIDVRPAHNLDSFLGQDIPVKIVKLNRRRGNVVVSRKMAMEEELKVRKSAALQVIEEGAVVTGTVKNLTDYGAFIDLGGIDGLLHVSDMSYGRVNHPSEVVTAGDQLAVKVLKFDREKERISLGLKQLVPDPWETIDQRYPSASRVIGRVVSVTDYGAFVELEPGVEALAHVSTFEPTGRSGGWMGQVAEGTTAAFEILAIDLEQKRIGVALVPEGSAGTEGAAVARPGIVPGARLTGKVERHENFGVFVFLAPGRTGVIPLSETGIPKEGDVRRALPVGADVEVIVQEIDPAGRRIRLSAKAVLEAREAEEVREWTERNAPPAGGLGTFADKLRSAFKSLEK